MDIKIIVIAPASTHGEPGGVNLARSDFGRLAVDGYVVDIAASPRVVFGVLNGPMLDASLPADGVKRCPVPSEIMVAGLEGSFQIMAAKRRADPAWSGLDTVGVAHYVAFWRGLRARIGRRSGEVIAWEDGEAEYVTRASLARRVYEYGGGGNVHVNAVAAALDRGEAPPKRALAETLRQLRAFLALPEGTSLGGPLGRRVDGTELRTVIASLRAL